MEEQDKKKQLIIALMEQVANTEEPVFSYVIPLIFSKKLASFSMIREDILFAKAAFERMRDMKAEAEKDSLIISSLYYAAVAQYGRCFNENKGGHSKLEPSDLFTEADAAQRTAHDELMIMRNSFVAHRDDNDYEQALVTMHIPHDGKDSGRTEYRVKSFKTISPKAEKLESYILLCDFILPKVEAKIQKQGDKTQAALFDNFTPEQINLMRIK